ncbi:MAG: PaaI family thioesterase [Dinoroseobacter sp.]|nr:PaaI family thioesterase [Dinoroseobacter sp.]
MSKDRTHIEKSFIAQGLMLTLGAQIERVEEGSVILSAPLSDRVSQQHGAAHAGLTFALGDSAAGYSALTLMGSDTEVMTVEMKINLLSPAFGDRLVATGKVEKAGKRLLVVTARVEAETDGQRKLVAIMQGTMIPVPLS